jgi:hypothetical protein
VYSSTHGTGRYTLTELYYHGTGTTAVVSVRNLDAYTSTACIHMIQLGTGEFRYEGSAGI